MTTNEALNKDFTPLFKYSPQRFSFSKSETPKVGPPPKWIDEKRQKCPASKAIAALPPSSCPPPLPFPSSRSFTIGNLHKRLTEARLNHTREKNRKAARGGERSTAVETEPTGRKRGRWTKEEGAKPLADGGESLRRVACQSYRRYHGGSSLFSLHRSSSLHFLFLSLPHPLSFSVHLCNNSS